MLKRSFSSLATKPKLVQLKHLPYDMGALEPVISGQTMEYHYSKHHRTYVNNLNALIAQSHEALQNDNVQVHIQISQAMKFNGGGHFNHEFFWETLCPVADSHRPDPQDLLHKEIVRTWGSWENFQERFEKRAAAVQGSGWGWVVYDKAQNRIRIKTTAE